MVQAMSEPERFEGTAGGGTPQYQESSSSGQAEADYRPPAQEHAHGAGQAGGKGGSSEETSSSLKLAWVR